MAVLIDNRQTSIKIAKNQIKKTAQAILGVLECPDSELSLSIVADDEMEALNRTYLNRQGPTNVIAFPMQEGDFTGVNPQMLGDVVISIEYAQKEAKDQDVSLDARFAFLLVHGVLHLLGYDHEKGPREEEQMWDKTNKILSELASLGIDSQNWGLVE